MQKPKGPVETDFSNLFQPAYRKVMIVGILLAALIQFSGINTVITYAPIILNSGGNSLDTAIFQTFVIGIINFAGDVRGTLHRR